MSDVGARTFLLTVLALSPAEAFANDITTFNTLQTQAPATIERISILNPKFGFRHFVIQRYGGVVWPIISFTVVNRSPVTIGKLYFTGVLKRRGRSIPLATQDFSLDIPGGLLPGERKRFDLDAELHGDWADVTKGESRNAVFALTLEAIDDAKGERLVK